MPRAVFFAGMTVAALAGAPASAQYSAAIDVPHDIVVAIMMMARDNLHRASLPDGTNVAPETADERALPLVSTDDATRVVDMASASASASWCGLEWENALFLPFMQTERRRGVWSGKQLAYIGLMHGITMGIMEDQYRQRGPCSNDMRARVERFVAEKRGRNNEVRQ